MEISEQIKRYLLSQHPDFKSPLDPTTKTLISVFDIICRNNIPATLSPIRQEQRFRTHHGEYHCTDIHGDIFLLINHVVESGIAKLNIEEPILMYEITPNGQKIQVPFSEDKLHNPDVIVVPNFVINQDFIREDRKFIFHGDLFNRGNQSMECFITMSNLIENYNAAQAGLRNPNSFLKWLTGNHDMDFISTQTIYGNEFIPYTRRQLTFIKAKLSELNQQGNFVFCHYTPETNTLSSHTIFSKTRY